MPGRFMPPSSASGWGPNICATFPVGASISITFQGPRLYQALPTMQFILESAKSSAKLSGQVESTARKGGSSS